MAGDRGAAGESRTDQRAWAGADVEDSACRCPTPARSKRAVVAPLVSDSNPVAYVGAHRSHASMVWAIRSFGLFGGQGHGRLLLGP